MSTAIDPASSESAPERQESGIRSLVEDALESLERLEEGIVRLGLPEAPSSSSQMKNSDGQALEMRRPRHIWAGRRPEGLCISEYLSDQFVSGLATEIRRRAQHQM